MGNRNFKGLAEDIVATVREPLVILDDDLRVIFANSSFFSTFKVSPEETLGRFIFDLGNRQWDIPELKHLLRETILRDTPFEDFLVKHDFERIGQKVMAPLQGPLSDKRRPSPHLASQGEGRVPPGGVQDLHRDEGLLGGPGIPV